MQGSVYTMISFMHQPPANISAIWILEKFFMVVLAIFNSNKPKRPLTDTGGRAFCKTMSSPTKGIWIEITVLFGFLVNLLQGNPSVLLAEALKNSLHPVLPWLPTMQAEKGSF